MDLGGVVERLRVFAPVPGQHLLLGERVRVVSHVVQVHALRVGALLVPEERVAVLGGSEARSEHLAVERGAVDAFDAPRRVVTAAVGHVRAALPLEVPGLGRRCLQLYDAPEPPEQVLPAQHVLSAVLRVEPHDVHQVPLYDPDVEQVLARGSLPVGSLPAGHPRRLARRDRRRVRRWDGEPR